jgi:hypothetical protein
MGRSRCRAHTRAGQETDEILEPFVFEEAAATSKLVVCYPAAS